MPELEFQFQPRWKEELVCTYTLGNLVLDLMMGVTIMYLPNQHACDSFTPDWAKPHWQTLHDQLQAWCSSQKILMEARPLDL